MSEDTPVNTGVDWPAESEAGLLVRRMQVKLHHWAGADRSRRQRGQLLRRLQRQDRQVSPSRHQDTDPVDH
jgi:hypothetical protein